MDQHGIGPLVYVPSSLDILARLVSGLSRTPACRSCFVCIVESVVSAKNVKNEESDGNESELV